MEEDKKEGFWERLRKPFRLVAINPETFEEKWEFRLSNYNLLTLLSLLVLVVAVVTSLLFIFTPMGRYLPTLYESESQVQLQQQRKTIDSLYQVVSVNEQYVTDIKKILAGENFGDSAISKKQPDIEINVDEIKDIKSEEDSILREQMENEVIPSDLGEKNMTETNFFYSPIKGKISNSYNPKKGHFGVDIVAPKNSTINSTLGGAVLFASWTSDDGNVIIIYHGGDLISVYKHNSKLLKKVGEKVKSGDPIAIIGNTGENTDGTHLHFELWQDGNSLDPENLISFE
ncbi:MAG: peptidoglycan DD-metalloendopeptidase family protein [Crocinitomicaceae bacterium]|nr:peptidoglycan DD-metalloendopeptidase family protein [Crocinitomicaceae bacterium]